MTRTVISWTARVVAVALLMGGWLYLFREDSHATPTPTRVDHCHIPAAVANSRGPKGIRTWCREQRENDGRVMDPTLKFIYKCGGSAVIATWFVKKGKAGASLGALAACSWASLFEGKPAAWRSMKRHAAYRPV